MRIIAGLKSDALRRSRFYSQHGFRDAIWSEYLDSNSSARVSVFAEDKSSSVFGDGFYYQRPDHDNDIYVHTMGEAFRSSHYHTREGPVGYIAEFAIRISENGGGPGAIVSVRSFNARIFHGKEFNAHVGGHVWKSITVPPAPEEEHILIAYLANILGERPVPLGPESEREDCPNAERLKR